MGRGAKILAWFGLWTAVGLFFSTQLYLINGTLYRRTIHWREAILGTLPEWWFWFLMTPAMLWLARRFPFDRRAWGPPVLVHFCAGAGMALLEAVFFAWLTQTMDWPVAGYKTFSSKLWFFISVKSHWNLLTYSAVVAAAQASEYYRRYQEREALLAQTQLQVLKSQLHPHFLFNALHATLALIRKDPPAAERMIVRLGELLRSSLESGAEQEVPLRQEIRFLEQYLEIERTRFADRLRVEMDIDPGILEARVPNMILQPLVENAVKHGLSPRSAPGNIRVTAARNNGCLHLEVSDDGVGLRGGTVKEGIGLGNTRARLRQLYGDAQKMECVAPADGGFSTRIQIPVRV